MNEKIFELGHDCYWDGSVGECIKKENNKYTATVAIQENYSVKLKLDKRGGIIWDECDCSCLDAPYCKHVIAVFCAVTERECMFTSCLLEHIIKT